MNFRNVRKLRHFDQLHPRRRLREPSPGLAHLGPVARRRRPRTIATGVAARASSGLLLFFSGRPWPPLGCLQLGLSRQREFYCRRNGRADGWPALRLDECAPKAGGLQPADTPQTNAFPVDPPRCAIVKPFFGGRPALSSLFSTHPPS